MVEFAKAKYCDEKTSFALMDIGGTVPKELERGFDHAFSSYAIQFVPNQEKSFSNINSILKDGGSCLLMFSGRNGIYDVIIAMAQSKKWNKWMKEDLDTIVSRYHKIEDAASEVRRIMEETGFKDIYVEENKTFFDYEKIDDFIKMVESANLFHLPPEVLREYAEDYEKFSLDIKAIERLDGKPEAGRLRYNQLIAYGTK